MNNSVYLKRYSTYSKTGMAINVEGNFPIQFPSSQECNFLTKKEQMQIFIEKNNTQTGTRTCEDIGKLIDKKLFTEKPNIENEEYILSKIIYGNEELECYECLA
jgi:hypothetical protein